MARESGNHTHMHAGNSTFQISRRKVLGGVLAASGLGLLSVASRPALADLAQEAEILDVAVFPRHGTITASTGTEITFRGLPPASLGNVVVAGSESGGHSGILLPHADGQGESFLLDLPFRPGEEVTVRAEVPLAETPDGSLTFTVAHPANHPEIPTIRESENPPSPAQSFRSRPDLRPPVITITTAEAGTSPGYVFVGAKTQLSQNGPMIVDNAGDLVWFLPQELDISSINDVRVQSYQGQPVMTWWEGVSLRGQGLGHFVIMNSSYQLVATVQAGNGYPGADLHEFLLTPEGTAFIVIYNPVLWDLSPVGGSRLGTAVDSVIQEIEVESGRVLFEWHSLDHIALEESIVDPPDEATQGYDYVHVNSIEIDSNGDVILSARNTSAVYKVDRLGGDVIWRLNGTHSDFARGENTETAYHHDARLQANGSLTLFDNASSDEDSGLQSRGVELSLDTESMTSTLVTEYTHPTNILSVSQGNMQVLPNGNVLIGWGSSPVFSEFSPDGDLLFNGRFPQFVNSYRAYRFPWTALPSDAPAVAVEQRSPNVVTIFASWNGATEIASWRFFAGPAADQLEPVETAAKSGFETRITIRSTAQYFAAQAEDSAGQPLGISASVSLEE